MTALPVDLDHSGSQSYFALVWRGFRRHRLALFGSGVLGFLILVSLAPEFFAPYGVQERSVGYTQGPPTGIHFFDAEGAFHLRPFVYGRSAGRDPVTFARTFEIDETTHWPVTFLITGERYRLFGLFETRTHLFGVTEGSIHLFGTDALGRDVFSRTLMATQTSLSIGAIAVVMAFSFGLLLGGIAGYRGGAADSIIMRLIDFIRSVPTLPLWLGLAAALPRHWSALEVYFAITLILAAVGWTHLARRVRGKLLSLKDEDFVTSARLAGAKPRRIIFRHMMPSFLSYIIVDLTLSFPYIILAETSLSFLGLGLREPVVSWGVLLYSAQNIRSISEMPWLLIPGLVVIIAVLAFNFIGDGLRDAADPYNEGAG